MQITELTAKELLALDQILKTVFSYRVGLIKEPDKLKFQDDHNLSFERLKYYCQEIGITLRQFEPKGKQNGFIYFQPIPTEEKDDATTPSVEDLFREYFTKK